MHVREAMSAEVLTVGPDHTLRQAARMMAARGTGSAVVLDPDAERTGAHMTWDVVYAGPDWTLEEASLAMARGGFRHLVVLEGGEVLGVISVRDIMRVWARERALKTS